MIAKDGKLVHPLRRSNILYGNPVDRENKIFCLNETHNRSWFILDLALPGQMFIPAGQDALVTVDGMTFGTHNRRIDIQKG